MRVKYAALANDPMVEQAAQDFLLSGGSALGAVLTGYFAAAGAYAGVLLGPVSLLVAGVGSGARAFDGRLRQPGRGTKRPRGFKADEPIPDAARVAIPTSAAALLVALAYDGAQKLSSITKPGIQAAERSGAEGRAQLLKRVRSIGAGAFSEPSFVRAFLHVAGPSQGGLVTPSDFAQPGNVDLDHAARERSDGEATVLDVPWSDEPGKPDDVDRLGIGSGVCAVDVRGSFAALCYRRTSNGLPLEELDLEAPLVAVPVQRGVTRLSPGAPLATPAPMTIRRNATGALVEVSIAPAALNAQAIGERGSLRIKRDAGRGELETSR